MQLGDQGLDAQSASLTVVIVTFGQPKIVAQCLDSVMNSAGEVGRLSIWVVDNCSPDETPDMVRIEYPSVHLIASRTNDGFAVANNKVLRQVQTQFILVLNPDCILTHNTLRETINHMMQNPTIGVLGCRLVTDNGSFDHAAKRNIPNPSEALAYFLGSKKSRYLAPEVNEHSIGEVDAVNGAFMLIRRAAMDEVGLLDEHYWMYAEDMDWCLRFREKGWLVTYYGAVTCIHLKSKISGRARSPRLNYHFHRSMARFYETHLASGNRILDRLVILAVYARLLIKIPRDSLSRVMAKRPHDAS